MKISTINVLIYTCLFLVCSSIILFFVGPHFVQSLYSDVEGESARGAIGDAFGGMMGPVIAWIAALLTFAAFYIQYVANREQRKQFSKQADDTTIERFENRFFEMIRIHKANVEEQNIQNIVYGRKVFTTYYFELRYIFFVLEKCHDQNPPTVKLTKEELTNLAYLIFFFGIGHVTKSVFAEIAPKYFSELFFVKTIELLESQKAGYKKTPPKDPPQKLEISHKGQNAIFLQIYEPFTGHGTKIGHYFRHLFQSVKYVATHDHPLFTEDLKRSYVRMLRAQLSNFEQILLYYNSISILGSPWISNGYIRDYKMIKNLPLSFADFGIHPTEKFQSEINNIDNFFDWTALKSQMS